MTQRPLPPTIANWSPVRTNFHDEQIHEVGTKKQDKGEKRFLCRSSGIAVRYCGFLCLDRTQYHAVDSSYDTVDSMILVQSTTTKLISTSTKTGGVHGSARGPTRIASLAPAGA